MNRVYRSRVALTLLGFAAAACSSATQTATTAAPQPAQGGPSATASQRRSNPADVNFMSGMIPHHAQAVIMAGWAKSHGARSDVLALCERIVVGQRDEIATMQTWLRDRGLPVPDATSTRHKMTMNGMTHGRLMP